MKEYIAIVINKETKTLEKISAEYSTKKAFERDLRRNGYAVKFISTEENFHDDCQKYEDRKAVRRYVAKEMRKVKKMIEAAEKREAEILEAAETVETEESHQEETTETVAVAETVETKKIKWAKSNVTFNRGNHEPCIFKFNNSKVWFNSCSCCTTQTIKAIARRMAKHYKADVVEIKYLWNEDGTTSEPRENVVDFIDDYWGEDYKFRIELPVKEGERRQFKYFDETEIFE